MKRNTPNIFQTLLHCRRQHVLIVGELRADQLHQEHVTQRDKIPEVMKRSFVSFERERTKFHIARPTRRQGAERGRPKRS